MLDVFHELDHCWLLLNAARDRLESNWRSRASSALIGRVLPSAEHNEKKVTQQYTLIFYALSCTAHNVMTHSHECFGLVMVITVQDCGLSVHTV